MLDRLGVYSRVELGSRYEILLENYIKTIQVEGLTALKMAKSQIYPAVCDYLSKVSSEVIAAKEAGLDVDFLVDDANALAKLVKTMKEQMTTLETNIAAAQASEEEIFEQALQNSHQLLENLDSCLAWDMDREDLINSIIHMNPYPSI